MKLVQFVGVLSVAALSGIASAANPVLVDSAGSGDFTSVQAAISSWTTGGSNASETAPFVIKVKAGSGPYDEGITLDPAVVGQGDIVGDIVVESDTPGTKVVFKLKITASPGALDDGLFINQNTHDVTFRDIVFTRSISTPAQMPTDELVRIDESAPNTDMNLISFYNCVFTEVNAAGDPMTIDKAGALPAPPARGGPARIGGARLLQFWGDAGESNQLIIDNCVFYGGTSTNVTARNDGAGAEFIQIHNCLSTWAGFDAFNVGGTNPASVLTVTGTDQTAGPLNCTASINPLVGGHGLTIAGAVGHQSNISGMLISSKGTASTPAGTNATRGISGGSTKLTVSDTIIEVPFYGIVDTPNADLNLTRVTIHTPGTTVFIAGTPSAGTLTVTDSIISGAGTKFPAAYPGGNIFNNVAFPTSGPYAVGSVGLGTQNNVINDDPAYVTLDPASASYMDVPTPAYASAASGGTPLAGGADYVGPATRVNDWSVY